jgi:cell division protein FtsB
MKNILDKLSWQRLWLGFFVVWFILLSGLLDFWVSTPGLKQWFKVESTLHERRQEIAAVEARSASLHETAHQLESNAVAQEREIRRVLGYLGEQEVVFEFTR